MSTTHVALCRVAGRAETGATMPVVDSVALAAQTLASSATSQQSSVLGVLGYFWRVTAIGAAQHVLFGTNPVAAPNAGYILADGATEYFAVTVAGEKFACRDI